MALLFAKFGLILPSTEAFPTLSDDDDTALGCICCCDCGGGGGRTSLLSRACTGTPPMVESRVADKDIKACSSVSKVTNQVFPTSGRAAFGVTESVWNACSTSSGVTIEGRSRTITILRSVRLLVMDAVLVVELAVVPVAAAGGRGCVGTPKEEDAVACEEGDDGVEVTVRGSPEAI